MQPYRWDKLAEEPLNPLLGRKVIHGEKLTVARIRLSKSVVVPAHRHANEQISMVQEGSLRFIFPDRELVLHAGDMLVIAPDEEHGVEALEDSVAIDLFAPVREDWVRGDDAYLRR